MRLHQDKDAFRVLLDDLHSKTGYRTDVLEKDYYVVLILKELAGMQKDDLPAFFKGGTALYKALKITNRFSEDIDLSVDTRGCTRSQSDKRLDRAAKKYTSLSRDPSQGKTNRSEVISIYTYEPVTVYDRDDALQRFGKLKVEATSFTISEPIEALEVSVILYELASAEQKKILQDVFDVNPFDIQTITLERIFIDKIFAAEAYVRSSSLDHRAFEAAKHIYDLVVMENHSKIIQLLSDADHMESLLKIRMEEELKRLDGIPGVAPDEFVLFTQTSNNTDVRKAYEIMQDQYVLRPVDRIDFDTATSILGNIHKKLLNNPSWLHSRPDIAP
ncbi:MAG TPA: nucleotidyl transferase AbiEii/AbiGii toxin family protein [Syntrophales bacterium]|jgi:predicted nucleotidyltransferase component of viral defense system|nr:nucleotidyl transferase AbiEii/AbiGii toxin family protein [Syntrophales bacterium]